MMRLSEIVSTLSPATFTIVSLVIFLAVFVAIAIATFRPSARAAQTHANGLPLDDGAPVARAEVSHE